ncbi:MAG: hypothetical protein KF893_03745 [Caldilineaceae bacterium]|nr:hypothetical protein [Caldilineaceae bacterium]
MSAVFDAYDLHVERLVDFYRRINTVITYPDGMTTSLGIIYWGRDEHLEAIERAIPRLRDHGALRFKDIGQAISTPARARKLYEQTGISQEILRILKHDLELWLPQSVSLDRFAWFQNHREDMNTLLRLGMDTQLAIISAGQTPSHREQLALHLNRDGATTDEIVKLCDYYRTGANMVHIRAKIYYEMGMDTWQKWSASSSEVIIARFREYIQENHLEGQRLIPWPKEVRNGIEWAKMHVEIYAVQW